MTAPLDVRVEVLGGDALGRGDQPALSWRLPDSAAHQLAYRIRTDDGLDTGWVESDRQSFVRVPLFDVSRRRTGVRVQVRTEIGESGWSEPLEVDSGLLGESDWTGAWVGVTEPERAPKGERPAYWLRRTFTAGAPSAARLYVTALGLYEVFLNGRRVGDVELAPGFTQYQDRVPYQAYDIEVPAGRSVLAVLLADGWYRGQVGLPRAADQFGTELALRLQLEASADDGWSTLTDTDQDWRWALSHVLAADLIGGQREDRRLVDPSVHDPGIDDRDWSRCVARDVDVAVVRPIAPSIRRVEEIRPVAVTTDPAGASVVDLGQNINGWARLTALGPEGTALTLRYGEHLDGSGTLTTTHLDIDLPIVPEPLPLGQVDGVVSAGRPGDVFEPRFTTHGFQYASVEGHPGALTIDDMVGVVVHSDLRRTGWFSCSDERLNRLHDAAVWSLRGNMCGVPTDCPQRERAGWTGDWQVFAPTAAFLFDVLGFTRSWLRDVTLDQRADGCVANISPLAPAEGFAGPLVGLHGSAGWGDVVVDAPWQLYRAYGDESLLWEMWPSATAWVEYAARAAAGGRHPGRAAARPELASHEQFLWDTGFHWGEWLEPGFELSDFGAFAVADKSEVATAYLARSATTLARVGEVIGAPSESVERYRLLGERAREAWRAEFVDDDGRLRVATQAAHVRALAFGLVPDDVRPVVAGRLADLVAAADDHLTTGFLSTGLLLPTLADGGQVDVAYRLLRQDTEPSWLTMVDRGASTVWEHWNGIDADGVAHDSLNHYSKGAVITFLHRYVAGLQATSPGYRTFRVRPVLGGGLTAASATLDSPFGRIEASWALARDRLELDVTVPGGTTAELVLPDGSSSTVGPGQHRRSGPAPVRGA